MWSSPETGIMPDWKEEEVSTGARCSSSKNNPFSSCRAVSNSGDTVTVYKSPDGESFCGACYDNKFLKVMEDNDDAPYNDALAYEGADDFVTVGTTIVDLNGRRLASSSNLSPLILLSMLPLLFLVYWFVVRRFTQTSRKAGNRQHPGEAGNFSAVEPALDMV